MADSTSLTTNHIYSECASPQILGTNIKSPPSPVRHPLTIQKAFTKRELDDHYERTVYGRQVTGQSLVECLVELGPAGITVDAVAKSAAELNALVFKSDPNVRYAVVIDLGGTEAVLSDAVVKEAVEHILKHFRVLRVKGATPARLKGLFAELNAYVPTIK